MTYFTADTTTIKDLFTLSAADISLSSLLICTACSLVIGAAVAAVFCRGQRTSRGYALTLALLPAIVQMVIMLVNGNIGTGVAVMGAFSLVRFRSAPGSAREICAIFLTMAAGLACGTQHLRGGAHLRQARTCGRKRRKTSENNDTRVARLQRGVYGYFRKIYKYARALQRKDHQHGQPFQAGLRDSA